MKATTRNNMQIHDLICPIRNKCMLEDFFPNKTCRIPKFAFKILKKVFNKTFKTALFWRNIQAKNPLDTFL